MTAGLRFRGRPVVVLTAILAIWVSVRVSLWQSPFAYPETPLNARTIDCGSLQAVEPVRRTLPLAAVGGETPAGAVRLVLSLLTLPSEGSTEPLPPLLGISTSHLTLPSTDADGRDHATLPATGLAGSLAEDSLFQAAEGSTVLAAPLPVPTTASPPNERRWSADAWLLVRDGLGGPVMTGQPSYGRSQTGRVLRYSLAPASPLRPSAYLRGSAAVAGPREQELAVGLSVRPVRALPLRLAVEGRLGESGGSAHVRPAAYAVTEVPPIAIASETRLEVYAQAGYVAGDFATAFVDGQARLERALMRSGGGAEVTAGAGVWGGAQEGSSRLDVGPSAAVSFRLGQARARLAADYRFRVAGEAAPASGPALTLSAGF